MTARGSVENKTRIDMALSRLAENMNPMVVEIIEEAAGRNRWSPASLGDTWKGRIRSVEDIRKSQDPALFLHIVLSAWDNGFSRVMSPQGASYALVDKVRQIRNATSHHDMNLGNQPRVEDSIKAINDLRAAVVKTNTNMNPRRTEEKTARRLQRTGTKSAARNLWQRPVVRTVIIAIAAAVIFELITRLAGLP